MSKINLRCRQLIGNVKNGFLTVTAVRNKLLSSTIMLKIYDFMVTQPGIKKNFTISINITAIIIQMLLSLKYNHYLNKPAGYDSVNAFSTTRFWATDSMDT